MLVRISGVNLPKDKRIIIALTSIYGVGKSLSQRVLKELDINEDIKTRDLSPEQEKSIRDYIENNFKVEGDLRRETMLNIKHLQEVGAWRGLRHAKSLPVRGQRTRTNSRTVRGNVRKTAGSGKHTAAEKT